MRSQAAVGGNSFEREMQRLRVRWAPLRSGQAQQLWGFPGAGADSRRPAVPAQDMYEDRLKQEREKHNKELETVKTQTEEKYFAALQVRCAGGTRAGVPCCTLTVAPGLRLCTAATRAQGDG